MLGAAFIVGIAAFAFGLFLVLNNGDGNAAPPVVSATTTPTDEPTATPGETREPTAPPQSSTVAPTLSPTAPPVPTVTPTPGPTYDAILSSWSPTESIWITPAHNSSTSNYSEGDFVPFLLQIDDVVAGTTYDVAITYDCLSSESHAFDFLGGITNSETQPLLTAPGPGSTVPDSALAAPDDPSLLFDDNHGTSFRAWGAVFSAASSPTPLSDCTGAKTVNLSLLAQATTLRLVWTGHLASSADWGAGAGAASAAPFELEIDVRGEVQHSFTMVAGSID